MDKKYHFVYKTTNIINGRFYIGVHSTNSLSDGYIGSGFLLKSAIDKYGKENFIKEILSFHPSRRLALKAEAAIVTADFCRRKEVYNIAEGGGGCLDQNGSKNHRYGKPALNRKEVRATHKDGRIIHASSIRELSTLIHIDRANIRNLISKGIRGKRGWMVEVVKI